MLKAFKFLTPENIFLFIKHQLFPIASFYFGHLFSFFPSHAWLNIFLKSTWSNSFFHSSIRLCWFLSLLEQYMNVIHWRSNIICAVLSAGVLTWHRFCSLICKKHKDSCQFLRVLTGLCSAALSRNAEATVAPHDNVMPRCVVSWWACSSWTGGTDAVSAQHWAPANRSVWGSGAASPGARPRCSSCAACERFLSRLRAAAGLDVLACSKRQHRLCAVLSCPAWMWRKK